MKSISIFGLGYVGAVTAACLASRGHKIVGVDPNRLKVDQINSGIAPIVETGVQEMITAASRVGRISATQDVASALAQTEISFVSVGTPGQRNGKLDVSHVRRVAVDIGAALRAKKSVHWIVIRSTVLPGTTEHLIVPTIEAASGKKAGRDFIVCFNPEFLREATAVSDFFNPPFTVIGCASESQAAPVRELYEFLPSEIYDTAIATAEIIKYSCNAFHALKIAFANEIGTVCSAIGVNAKEVADILKSDTRLNISKAYLTPGFAFGGSCLPKDLRALTHHTRELDLKLPLLESILPSNSEHIDRVAEAILSLSKRRVGVFGLSFKPGTDDLRESSMVHLVKKLIAEGCSIRIWDKNVSMGQLIGSNRDFIEAYIPHIGTLLEENVDRVLDEAEVVVLGTNLLKREQLKQRLRKDQHLIDLDEIAVPVKQTFAVAAGA